MNVIERASSKIKALPPLEITSVNISNCKAGNLAEVEKRASEKIKALPPLKLKK